MSNSHLEKYFPKRQKTNDILKPQQLSRPAQIRKRIQTRHCSIKIGYLAKRTVNAIYCIVYTQYQVIVFVMGMCVTRYVSYGQTVYMANITYTIPHEYAGL